MLDLPEQVRPVLGRTSPMFVLPELHSKPRPRGMLPLDDLVRRAEAVFPKAELAWIETPAAATGTVRINLAQPGEPSRRFPRTNVWLDPYTGKVLLVRNGLKDSAGDKVLNWLHPLHGGEAFALPGRVLAFICGFVPALLLITGWRRWVKRSTRLRGVHDV